MPSSINKERNYDYQTAQGTGSYICSADYQKVFLLANAGDPMCLIIMATMGFHFGHEVKDAIAGERTIVPNYRVWEW